MRWIVLPQLGGSARLLAPLMQFLPEGRVIEPPGFGDAPPPHGVPSTRALAEIVAKEIHEERFALLGISLGSMIAQWIAIDAPERVASLVLASSSARGRSGVGMHMLSMARCLVGPSGEVTACLAGEVLEGADPHVIERARKVERAAPRSRRDIAWLAAAAAAHDAHRELASIQTPTLVVCGSEDEIFAPPVHIELRKAIPRAELEIIEGAGHDVALEAPEELARMSRASVERG